MTSSRLWLALVVVLFCLPLFVGLGRQDLYGDEAGHSFSVDRILETGDWLGPRGSPHEDEIFVEKPPLKFWLVAAPIRFGLLPHNEFGLRFWDALFGSIAFLYIFAIGSMLAGPLCGFLAVLILFSHDSVLFDHGIRGNNMEASLLLCYCGGMYHYIRWVRLKADTTSSTAGLKADPTYDSNRATWHAVAAGLYFVLGFMTKFVAAAFLPLVLLLTSLFFGSWRRRLASGWLTWLGIAVLAFVLIAPWFVYMQNRVGTALWQIMLGAHVYTRFTTYLDPAHVHPWWWYFATMYDRFAHSQALIPLIGGLVMLTAMTLRRRWPEGAAVLIWFVVPMILISFGTSKLYHYTYPFLPPLAIAGGYAAAMAIMLAPAPVGRALGASSGFDGPVGRILAQPVVRIVLAVVAILAAGLATGSLVNGEVRLAVGDLTLIRNSTLVRPLLISALCGILLLKPRDTARAAVVLSVATLLPLSSYFDALSHLNDEKHPLRSARDCLLSVEAREGAQRGLYVYVPDQRLPHAVYYYMRRVQPWTRATQWDPVAVGKLIEDSGEARPALLWVNGGSDAAAESDWDASLVRAKLSSVPSIAYDDLRLVLPGPYAACAGPTS